MSNFLNYAIPGIPQGCEYALIAVGLVLTFRATGVFNLAFGAQAFAAAYAYDLLNQYEHWSQLWAFVAAVLVISPAIGLALDRFLFRHIPTASTTAKVLSTLGVLIAIPSLIPIFFGTAPRTEIGFLWLNPQIVYAHVYQTPLNGTVIATTVITLAVVAALVAMFRWSSIGLQMRAVVESRRLAQLEGVNASAVAAGAWALSSALAGLAGVLMLPQTQNLDPTSTLSFTTLLVAGLTAAALASFRSMPLALMWSLVLGVVTNLLVWGLPSGSVLKQNVGPALPFLVLVAVLLFNPRIRHLEQSTDPMASVDPPPPPPSIQIRDRRLDIPVKWGWRLLLAGFVVSSLTWLPDNWVFPFALGIVFSIIFLSITLITGLAGQLSLCQATFAGVGGFFAGQMATHFGVPILLGAVLGGIVAAGVGVLVALPALRLSGLPLTLVTLAFAIFADQVLFQYSWSGGGDTGVNAPRPGGPVSFANGPGGDSHFLILLMIILALVMGGMALVMKGTVGRYLAAIRGSQTAAASLGISLTRAKITVFALSAGIAGLGGALYASTQSQVGAGDFGYEFSLVWVVAVITTGAMTIEGAIQAGVGLAVFQQILNLYVPPRFIGIEFILFAVGTLTYAQHPEGIVEYQKTRWMNRIAKLFQRYDERRGRATPGTAVSTPGSPSPAQLAGPAGATGA